MQGSVADRIAKQAVAPAPAVAAVAAVLREGALVAVLLAGSRRRCPRRPTAEASPAVPGVLVLVGIVPFLVFGSRHDPGKMSRRHLVVRSCRRETPRGPHFVWRTGGQEERKWDGFVRWAYRSHTYLFSTCLTSKRVHLSQTKPRPNYPPASNRFRALSLYLNFW